MYIFKYELSLAEHQIVRMPKGARILSVQAQKGKPVLWALVDVEQADHSYSIHTFVTGFSEIPANVPPHHLGTYQLADGDFIGHVFLEK